MSWSWKLTAILFGSLLLAPAAWAAPTREEISLWVRQLGDDHFRTREKASRLLWSAGEAAEPVLREALKNPDPEVARRAGEILDKFKYGIYPDTPQAIVTLIGQYRASDQNNRQVVLLKLFEAGRPGYVALLKLAALEEDNDVRRALFEQIAREASQAAETMLAEGHPDSAEDLLELTLAGSNASAIRNYAAFCLVRGNLDDRIGRYKPRAESGDKQAAEVLVYLYRARGDLAAARQAAEQAGKAALIEGILFEQGDWKALAQALSKKPDLPLAVNADEAASSALKATCYRLASDTNAFEAELRKAADESGWLAARALFFNDRPQEAIAALEKARDYATVFEFLTLQGKYREAFALADRVAASAPAGNELNIPPGGDEVFLIVVARAKALYLLGEKDKSRELFTRLASEIKDDSHASQDSALMDAEYQLGLKDLAFGQCASVMARNKTPDGPTWMLSRVFPKNTTDAQVWLKFFRRKYPNEEPAATVKRLRALLDSETADKDFPELAREAEQAAKDVPPPERVQWLQALADTSLAVGKEDLAQSFLLKASEVVEAGNPLSAGSLVRLGDFLAEKKRWKEAAEAYGRASERDRKQPVALYLHGWALTQMGKDKEGQQLMDRAHWLPLGNDVLRYELAETLAKHGLTEEARKERDFILRTGAFQSVPLINVQNRLEADALARKDYLQAAACCDRVILAVLQTGASFIKPRAYLNVPYGAHRYRARACLAAGRLADAQKEIQLCLAAMPGDADLPILLVPEMEKGGYKKEADDLFAKVFDLHVKLCSDYPRSAWCHNSLAWLGARCHRQLDPALEHARKAVELEAQNAGYLDTLAEVHFQRGDKDQAIETMKKCIQIDPKNEYFGKQLKRFEAGDPSVEVPE